MKFSARFYLGILMLVTVIACSRPAEDTSGPAAQPGAAVPNSEPPSEQSSNTASGANQSLQPAAGPTSKAPNATPTVPVTGTAASKAAPTAPNTPPAMEIVRVPAGLTVTVVMIDAVGTDTNKVGDTFMASLAEPILVNGKVALDKGTKVQGQIATLDEPGRVRGRAAMSLVLTQVLSGAKTYSIASEPFSVQAESDTKKDAVKVGGGAAIGAVIGAIAGGKKGAAVGAAVGGGAGTTAVLATRGSHLRIDSETKVNFVLKNDIPVEVSKSTS